MSGINGIELPKHADSSVLNEYAKLLKQAVGTVAESAGVPSDDSLSKLYHQIWRIEETLSRQRLSAGVSLGPQATGQANAKAKLPQGSDIVLVWGYTTDYLQKYPSEMIEQMRLNRQSYCNKHGYTNFEKNFDEYIDRRPLKKLTWLKMYAIQDALRQHPEAQWVMWIDSDVIIMDENVDLATHILDPKVMAQKVLYSMPVADRRKKYRKFSLSQNEFDANKIELIASQDEWFFNTGVLLIKNTAFMRDIIDNHWFTDKNIDKGYKYAEQDCMIDLLLENTTDLFNRWAPMPQSVFNAYHQKYTLDASKWHPGDFIAHFPGESRKGQFYIDTWNRYWAMRTPANDNLFQNSGSSM